MHTMNTTFQTSPHDRSRLGLIDAIKGIASQLIVLHHLAFYGPMSDVALELAPDLIRWLYDYGRVAVQAFLVIAGFLAARRLAPEGRLMAHHPWQLVWKRYLSLALPFLAALVFAMLSAAVARQLMQHDSIPAAPGILQILAHALLIHGITGVESLSAGVWYIAIDFQLFTLLVILLTPGRHNRLGGLLVGVLTLAALFVFNRLPELDAWGIYFFGSYGLGALAYWSSCLNSNWRRIALLVAIGLTALLFDYRIRIAVALALAIFLAIANRNAWMAWPPSRLLSWLGRISYAVFLIHFPVCLLVGALVHRLQPQSPAFNLFGILAAWLLSIAAGTLFYHCIERRLRFKG